MKVFVYVNLHQTRSKGQVWYSVKALEGDFKGRVIHRSGSVLLADAVAKVSAAGRARVLREKRKNVHAGLEGELVSLLPQDFVGSKVKYDPYDKPFFFHTLTELPFRRADRIYLSESGVRAA